MTYTLNISNDSARHACSSLLLIYSSQIFEYNVYSAFEWFECSTTKFKEVKGHSHISGHKPEFIGVKSVKNFQNSIRKGSQNSP